MGCGQQGQAFLFQRRSCGLLPRPGFKEKAMGIASRNGLGDVYSHNIHYTNDYL